MPDLIDESTEAIEANTEASKETSEAKGKSGRLNRLLSSEGATRIIYLAIGAAVIALVFRHLQFSTASICCGDYDGYYHIRWSRLLWENLRSGHLLPPTFTWLPLTTLDPKGYVDHHLLFHILQIPFTWFGDLRLGAKIAATLFGGLAVFACYWLIVRYRIRYTLVWLLALLACSAPFLYRLNMAKAPPIAIIFMVAGIYLLFQRKYVLLGPLMFLFVWTYSLFPTLFLAALIWGCVMYWSEGKFEWRPVAWTAAGMAAGFLINPYFPKNIFLFIEHVMIKMTPGEFSTDVGQEWYPYDSWVLLGNCFIAFAAMLTGYLSFDGTDRKGSQRSLFFLVFSTILMIATFRSRRFVEYWPPFAILFAAFSLQQLFDGARNLFGSLPDEVMSELQPYLDRQEQAASAEVARRRELYQTIAVGSVAVLLFITLLVNVRGIKRFKVDGVAGEIASSEGRDHYRGGMEWMRANVPAGERIFNTDWDDFPKMFYYDTTHSYVSGLDPTYLLDKNPELSKLYKQITLGEEKDPGPIIRDRFGARYVFSDKETVHDDFYANAMESGWFDQVYEDNDAVVLRLRDQKGEAPPESLDEGDEPDDTGTGTDTGDETPLEQDAQP